MAKAPRKFRWESAPRAFSCLRQPTSCEDAAANEGWQGRGLSLPAWEFLLCRERLMLLWALAQGLFPFQSITGARADEEPVCHRRPQGEDPHPSPSHTQPLLTPFRSCWAPGEGELPWELDHSWITAGSQLPSPASPCSMPCSWHCTAALGQTSSQVLGAPNKSLPIIF